MGAKKLSDGDKTQAVLDLLEGKGIMAEDYNRYGISPTYLDNLQGGVLEAPLVSHSPSL
jgi:hypothetical protein